MRNATPRNQGAAVSITTCERCDRFVDSDDDPECFVEIIEVGPDGEHKHDAVLCEPCREKTLVRHDDE